MQGRVLSNELSKEKYRNIIQPLAYSNVTVVAVSKLRTPAEIRGFCDLGHEHFAENYLNDAIEKMDQLDGQNITWHFIGALQSRKIKTIANSFDWVHTLESKKQCALLQQHHKCESPLNVCIQVNISGSKQKAGVSVDEVEPLVRFFLENQVNHVTLRGLMTMCDLEHTDQERKQIYLQCVDLKNKLNNTFEEINLDTLSMGMSDDYDLAVECGSTMVRLGTALFGPRPQRSHDDT